ncbi:DUF6663 family protein [Halomicrococcus gelatinilyticus]|uniref:DUF6663 family protein n=1 Tax=Halomicrococcus gelatinilyticus TaxID=1702103 RepID=UPI002E0E4523
MHPTTSGTFRVLDSPRAADERLLLDVDSHDPTYVTVGEATTNGEGSTADDSADGDRDADDGADGDRDGESDATGRRLLPGYLVDATLEWVDDEPTIAECSVRERTLFAFADDATNLFEAATEACREARTEGIASDVTQGTDGDVNGALYAFAEQGGERDLFEEFRSGVRPLDPLIERAAEGVDDPQEVFVLRPADLPCVVVYIVLRKESMLADTVRDTYDCPRPEE